MRCIGVPSFPPSPSPVYRHYNCYFRGCYSLEAQTGRDMTDVQLYVEHSHIKRTSPEGDKGSDTLKNVVGKVINQSMNVLQFCFRTSAAFCLPPRLYSSISLFSLHFHLFANCIGFCCRMCQMCRQIFHQLLCGLILTMPLKHSSSCVNLLNGIRNGFFPSQ